MLMHDATALAHFTIGVAGEPAPDE